MIKMKTSMKKKQKLINKYINNNNNCIKINQNNKNYYIHNKMKKTSVKYKNKIQMTKVLSFSNLFIYIYNKIILKTQKHK